MMQMKNMAVSSITARTLTHFLMALASETSVVGLTGRMLMDNFGLESVENQSGFGGVDVGLMGHALHIDVGEGKGPDFPLRYRC